MRLLSRPLSRSLRAAPSSLAAMAALALLPWAAQAAEPTAWPQHPVTLIMGFNAGSGVDMVGRSIQEPMSQRLGQPIIIDYKSGAAGNIGSEYVARAKPDGYTLYFGTAATHGSNAALYKNLPFDVEADFIPVAPIIDVANVLTVNPNVLDVKNLQEFVAAVKANPGKYNYASTGNGAGTHMAFAELNARLGLDMVHVPYKSGGPAIADVMGGQVDFMFATVAASSPLVSGGKLRALAVSSPQRSARLPDVPTVAETVIPGYEAYEWNGVLLPAGTPDAISQQLHQAVAEVLKEPEVQQRLADLGAQPVGSTPAEFSAFLKKEDAKWGEVVKKGHIQLD